MFHNVSTALSFLIRAFFLYIFWTPSASAIVTTTGSHSGMAETAKVTATNTISKIGRSFITPTAKTSEHAPKATNQSITQSFFNLLWSGV